MKDMYGSEVARKFLSKIEAMTFEEIDERASRAPSIGIEGLVEHLPSLELLCELFDDQMLLEALKSQGVDNWDDYDLAIESLNEYEEDL